MRKLAFACLAAVAAVLVYAWDSSGVASSSKPDAVSVGSGPFWYMRTVGTMRTPRCLREKFIPPSFYGVCEGTVWFEVQMSVETWVGTDGTTRERMVEDWQRFVSASGRARWLATKKRVPIPISVAQGDALDIGSGHFPSPVLGGICCAVPPVEGPPGAIGGPVDVGDGLFTYRQLLSLPTSPRTALRRIEQAQAALRRRYAQILMRWHSPAARATAHEDLSPLPQAGRSIQELLLISNLSASPVPAPIRVALFRAAAALPGVKVNPNARDPLGRPGVLVSASYPHWEPVRFMFDPITGELLTGQPMNGGPPDVSGAPSTVVAQGLVNSVTALPAGVKAIRGAGAPPLWPSPPTPAMISISPAVGRPTTAFTVTLAATAGDRPRPAPTVWLGVSAGSAGRGTYRGGNVFDPCLARTSTRARPVATTRRAGKLIYVYRVRPPARTRTWCRGRYQLGIQVFPNPLPRRYTTPPYTGPSGTSIYFTVR
jgi:hypothetical protein